jgi:glycosyltransferase involved in cell wall biosynthesis
VNGQVGWRDRLKQLVLRKAHNIAVSDALRAQIHAKAVVIGNPYRDDLFRIDPGSVRDLDLVFLGRLVSDKGLDILFHALAGLRGRGLKPGLTVIGGGPEEEALRSLCRRLALDDQIEFVGQKTGAELVALLNRHRFIVVPSRWEEPFGLVALEGMACGCVPLVADGGGLPEAVGSAGWTFRRGDAADATAQIARLLDPATDLQPFRTAAPAHLARHTATAVAARYLQVMAEAVQR